MNFKCFFTGLAIVFYPLLSMAQVKIHSHNDYTHSRPFWEAYEQKAFSIEADVYLRGDSLMVAHQPDNIKEGNTLESVYLKPVVQLFNQHRHRVSADRNYTFYLMIDIKESWEKVLPVLIKRLEQYPDCFDRSKNPMALQIFISGNRPPDSTFGKYPQVIMFDGLPHKQYAKSALRKIVMISDNFYTYSHWNGKGELPANDRNTIQQLVRKAHQIGKPFRFWGAPDTPDCWKTLSGLGAEIINTDHIVQCRELFK